MKSVFYQGETPSQSQSPTPVKPPRQHQPPVTLNPFNVDNSNKKPAQKSIPELLELFKKINFEVSFPSPQMKINELYNVLSGEL
jgi:hypothetical protein